MPGSQIFRFRLKRDEHPGLYDYLQSLPRGQRSSIIRNTLIDNFDQHNVLLKLREVLSELIEHQLEEILRGIEVIISQKLKEKQRSQSSQDLSKITEMLYRLEQRLDQLCGTPGNNKRGTKGDESYFTDFTEIELTEETKEKLKKSKQSFLNL